MLPGKRRRRVHHGSDHLRRRRADAVPELPRALVLGVSTATDIQMSAGVPSSEDRWWPSPFGAEDQLGMLNHIGEEKRLQAMALVREGRLYDLAHPLDENIPVFPGRYFRQTLVTTAHHANSDGGVGVNDVKWVTAATTAGPCQTSPGLPASSGWASRRSRRSSREDGSSTCRRSGASSAW